MKIETFVFIVEFCFVIVSIDFQIQNFFNRDLIIEKIHEIYRQRINGKRFSRELKFAFVISIENVVYRNIL